MHGNHGELGTFMAWIYGMAAFVLFVFVFSLFTPRNGVAISWKGKR